jgi:hypothetical protein
MDPADKICKTGRLDMAMGWSMAIFAFGFILGGLTIILILGIVSLVNHRTTMPADQETAREPEQILDYPPIRPPLTVLSGGRKRSSA